MSARWRVGLAALVVAGLVTGGCTTQPEPTPTPTPTVTSNSRTDVNAQPRDTLTQGGVVRLRLAHLPTQWNPWHPDAAGDADLATLSGPLSAPAFLLDAGGRATANPDVLTGTEVRHDGATRVTLFLDSRATWGDGAPVTAADWIATWRAMTGQVAGVAPVHADGWAGVAEVAAGASEWEVVVTYRGVEPDWAEPLVNGPLRAASVVDAAAFSWSAFDPANYAGPFTVAHADATQGVVTLDPNPAWWGDAPRLAHIVYRTLTDDAAPAAFRNNELDLLPVSTREVLQKVRPTTDAGVRQAPGGSGRVLRLSLDGFLADAAVRRALLLAIDRAGLSATDLSGVTDAVSVWSDPLVLPSQPGYVDQARATGLEHDAAASLAGLAAAGFVPTPGGVLMRSGQPLALTYHLAGDDPGAQATFAALASALAEVSIQLGETNGPADITPETQTVSAFPLAHLPVAAASDPGLSDYVTRIDTETDIVRRADQASQLARLLWQSVDTIPLYQTPELVAVRTGLANVGADGYATTTWEDVGWQA